MTSSSKEPLHIVLQTALDTGDFARALVLCYERLKDAPDDADAHRHLAQLQAARGIFDQALLNAQRACDLTPGDPRAWSDLGRVQVQARDLHQAVASFRRAVTLDPRYADGWHNLGTALKKLGNREPAFTALKNALVLDPTRADTYLNLGNLLIETNQFEDAVECFERAAKHDPTFAAARSRLAQEFSQRGKVKRAEELFRQSLGLDPEHLQGWFGLGRTLEDLGEAEGALGCYLNVLARRPGHPRALGQYLDLVRGEAKSEVLAVAHSALANAAVQDKAKVLIGYGLAKYHDRRGEYAEAAAAGLTANAARRRISGPLDREKLVARIDSLIASYDAAFFAERTSFGFAIDQPVFIVGLPRSGTTLTDTLSLPYPLLYGAGELPNGPPVGR